MTRPILLFGATSIVGFNIARSFPNEVLPFITPGNRAPAIRGWPILKLEDRGWPESIFREHRPKILLYCHAVCDVPKCQAAPEWAWEMNVEHVRRVLGVLPQETRLVYVSSDHVFGGDGIYHEHSAPCPVSVYGGTRVKAEELVLARSGSLVVRVGLPIGVSPNGRTGHWDWLRYRIHRKLPITIIHDEYRSAIWVTDLAQRLLLLAESGESGIRHVPATRAVSRVELANYLLSLGGEPAGYRCESRHQRPAPHLGRVELASLYRDRLSLPLSSVISAPRPVGMNISCRRHCEA